MKCYYILLYIVDCVFVNNSCCLIYVTILISYGLKVYYTSIHSIVPHNEKWLAPAEQAKEDAPISPPNVTSTCVTKVKGTMIFETLSKEDFPQTSFKSAIAFVTETTPAQVIITDLTTSDSNGVYIVYRVAANCDTANSVYSTLFQLETDRAALGIFVTRLQREIITANSMSHKVKNEIHAKITALSIKSVALQPSSQKVYTSCYNGKFDAATETDVDCGGVCSPCPSAYMVSVRILF